MNDQMRIFINQIQETISQTQTSTSERLAANLETLDNKFVQIIGALSEQQIRVSNEASTRQLALSQQAQEVANDLNNKINTVAGKYLRASSRIT